MSRPYRSEWLESVATNAEALLAAAAAGNLDGRSCGALAREELRLVAKLERGERYASLRRFLEALSKTGER